MEPDETQGVVFLSSLSFAMGLWYMNTIGLVFMNAFPEVVSRQGNAFLQ